MKLLARIFQIEPENVVGAIICGFIVLAFIMGIGCLYGGIERIFN